MFSKLAAGAIAGIAAVVLAGSAFASPALTTSAVTLLDGPGADYSKLMDLPAEMHVNIVWCGLHDNWCLVEEHNHMGWLPMAILKTKGGTGVAALGSDSGGDGAGGVRKPTQSEAAALAAEGPASRSTPPTFSTAPTLTISKSLSTVIGH